MGANVTIVNNSMCVLTVTMEILGVPYYWENALAPGELMNRSNVGLVWFTLDVYPWHGGYNQYSFEYGTTPAYYMPGRGEEFTLLGDIGIRGFHSSLVGKYPGDISLNELTPLEAALVNVTIFDDDGILSYFGAPFLMMSMGWYVHLGQNTWEIRGGPHCETIQGEGGLKVRGDVGPRKIQIFDFPTGNERPFEILLIE